MNEYYEILGITENATDEEVDKAYNDLRVKYLKDRFLEGEAGNEAARLLTKIETAYTEILAYRKENAVKNGTHSFTDVEDAIKSGKYNEAQDMLDAFNDRNAEWHYLQSVLFYKKNWINESKKQLEIALNLDPKNQKYKEAFDKLSERVEANEKQFRSGNARFSGDADPRDSRQMGDAGNDCLTFCSIWCCTNCLCNTCCR